jgi:hypothetical protein
VAYRAAADATRQRADACNNQFVGPALQERGNLYRMPESRIPERFLSSPEGIQAFLAAGGDRGTLGNALVADLRASATNPDGTLNASKFASWQMRRGSALRAMPDVGQTLTTAAGAQQAVDQAGAAARQQALDYQRGAARHFLNAEPMQAVQSALSSRNPVADMGELAKFVAGDADAKAGLQRAVADYMNQRFIGNAEAGKTGIGAMRSETFQTFLRRNEMALSQVFAPDQMQGMRDIAADLQRSDRSVAGSKIPGQSNTAQDTAAQSRLSVLRGYLGHGATSAIAGLAGYLVGGVHGAIEGFGGAAIAKSMLDKMRAAGLERTDALLTEALLNPEIAQTLLTKASPGNRPFVAQRLGSQLGTLLATAGLRAEDRRPQPPQRPPAPAPFNPAMLPPARGLLMPGGALAAP